MDMPRGRPRKKLRSEKLRANFSFPKQSGLSEHILAWGYLENVARVWMFNMFSEWWILFHRRKSTWKKAPKIKSSSEQVFQNNFCRVPDSGQREEGKRSREFFEKVRVNAVFFGISGFWVGFWPSIIGTLWPKSACAPLLPLCAVKTCAVHPVFARVVGELRAADPSKCPKAHEAKC